MILPGQSRLTGSTVIPSGNPLDVQQQDHHVIKRRVITSSLREGKPWLIKPGQRMLFSLGWQIVYERETWTRTPTPKLDRCVTQFMPWMENLMSYRGGVLPVESCWTGRVLGPEPQRGPPQVTGGHPVLMRGARLQRQWLNLNATGQKKKKPWPLNILLWNAEGVFNKKVPLTE